jgi:hypothetical protein
LANSGNARTATLDRMAVTGWTGGVFSGGAESADPKPGRLEGFNAS